VGLIKLYVGWKVFVYTNRTELFEVMVISEIGRRQSYSIRFLVAFNSP